VSDLDLIVALRGVVGDDACLVRPEELFVYEADGLTLHRSRPRAVVLPEEKTQVARIVKACRAVGVPFVARGAGTGLSGGALALDGAVVIECARMDQILEVNPEDRYAVVQPGVINLELSGSLQPGGLHHRGQRRRELGRAPYAEVRHHHRPRARPRGGAPRWRVRQLRLRARLDAGL
jgi:glycolate oxidase